MVEATQSLGLMFKVLEGKNVNLRVMEKEDWIFL
jgi:hypothetical protein